MHTQRTHKRKSGFALLISIVTTSILLLVSFVVINIALKELVLSYSGQESQYAFYNADSGVECALYWDIKNPVNPGISAFDSVTPSGSIICNNSVETVTTTGGGLSSGGGPTTNYALPSQGATANANTTYGGSSPSFAINGSRVAPGGYEFWQNRDLNGLPDWVEVALSSSKSITEVDVFSVSDTFWDGAQPTPSDTFTQYGLVNFLVQYWSGSSWQTVPGGNVIGNNLVWKKITFPAVSTTKVRVTVSATAGANDYARVVELEVWGGGGGGGGIPLPSSSVFTIPFTTGCAVVTVTKNNSSGTTISSKGYNTCVAGATRKFERGVITTYQ